MCRNSTDQEIACAHAHGMQEVVSSNLIGSIVVSYAEYKTCVYLPDGGAAVTLLRKEVIYSFWKGAKS